MDWLIDIGTGTWSYLANSRLDSSETNFIVGREKFYDSSRRHVELNVRGLKEENALIDESNLICVAIAEKSFFLSTRI